jgi:biotin-(acetyl-CoA carboxylase) ligase
MKQTAVDWLESELDFLSNYMSERDRSKLFEQAKQMEKEQKGYTEEQAKQIWKAGQEYWKTSGSSITFEELTETFNTKEI